MQEDNPPLTISTLIAKKLAGEMTGAEQQELDRWIAASAQNKALYESVIDPANRASRDALLKDIDVNAAWAEVSNKVFNNPPQRSFSFYRIAASVTLLIAVGVALYIGMKPAASTEAQAVLITPGSAQAMVRLHDGKTIALSDAANQNKQFQQSNGSGFFNSAGSLAYNGGNAAEGELFYNEIIVPRGGEYKVTLADGTNVWLNSETQLKFPVQFPATERVVELTGEAYFEVAHEAQRPFIVNTLQQARIQVYGTKFNINAYADLRKVAVTLNEGRVSVRKENGAELMLQPNEQARIYEDQPDGIARGTVDAAQFSAWKDGMLVFDNMSLGDISVLLSRWYDVEFEFENDKIRQYRFTADIKRYGTFHDVLKFFEKTNQIQFTMDGHTIRIRDKQDG
jgi:transmembrane sensor